MQINCVIIEDESFARKELKRMLAKTSLNFHVVAELESVEESVLFFKTNTQKIDLIFCDIQLSDGISFDIFNQVSIVTPIIFTTAYNEFAIKAFEQNSIAYLLKPIDEEVLNKALNKYKTLNSSTNFSEGYLSKQQLNALEQLLKPKTKTRFIAKVGDQIKLISIDEAAYFFSEDKVVFLMKTDGKKLIIDYNLEQIEGLVDTNKFFRINRSFIAGIDSIAEVNKYFNSRLKLELKPKSTSEIFVSRNRVNEFLTWLDQ